MYKIDALEQKKTKNGKPYVVVKSGDKTGSCFRGFGGFKVGDEVDGEFVQSGNFTNFELNNKVERPNFMKHNIDAAVEKKNENIEEAQERKQEAIQLAGAFRDATLVTLASLKEQPFPTDEEFKAEWRKWVKFFLNEGDQPFI